MTSVFTVRCIGALLHTMQPGLGCPGASPCTRHSTRPVRLLPTRLGSMRRNEVVHLSGMPAGSVNKLMLFQQLIYNKDALLPTRLGSKCRKEVVHLSGMPADRA
jgi:hypothetical protein